MPGTSGLLHWPLFPCGSLSPPHSTVGFYTVPISKRVTSGRGFARASEATRHHILSFTATPDSGAGGGGHLCLDGRMTESLQPSSIPTPGPENGEHIGGQDGGLVTVPSYPLSSQ